jgi:predicted acylesterase/phospholipase RssA
MTIVEAAMATSAAFSFFDPVEIGDQTYLDGGTGANNPVDRVWNEAQALFGAEDGKIHNVVGCVLSIGTGDPGINSFSKNAWKVLAETLRNLATETEATERRFSKTHSYLTAPTASTPRYFRFNVQQGLQSVGLAEYKQAAMIKTVTEEYMDHRSKELEVLKISDILRAKNCMTLLDETDDFS